MSVEQEDIVLGKSFSTMHFNLLASTAVQTFPDKPSHGGRHDNC